MKVLVVEDEALIALDLILIAEGLGHEVIGPAASSAQALELAEHDPPDIAIVDISLQDGPSGLFVARSLAERFSTCVVLATGKRDAVDERAAPVLRVIRKPFLESVLVEVLREAQIVREGRTVRKHDPEGYSRAWAAQHPSAAASRVDDANAG